MPGDRCIVCGNTRSKDPRVSSPFPTDGDRRSDDDDLSYLSISCAFFQGDGAFIPWHSSHHFSAGTAWRFIGFAQLSSRDVGWC